MPKAYGSQFMYLYIYVCNLDFLKVAKNQALMDAVQAQNNNILNLHVIVLDFWRKALFTIYGQIWSPWMLLLHVPDSPED